MTEFIDSKFVNQTVKLDGNYFSGCEFKNCKLEYYGEADVSLIDCKFTDCQWRLNGAAGRTAKFLGGIYQGFGPIGKEMINTILNQDYITPHLLDESNKIHSGENNE